MKSLKAEVHGLKRSISQMTEQQGELFHLVKSLKKSSEASHFDMGKCCHTVCIKSKAHVFKQISPVLATR